MAKFSIKDSDQYYVDIGSGGRHHATSWQAAVDKNFYKIIAEEVKSTKYLTEWETPLPKPIGDRKDPNVEEFYSDEATIYVRCKIFVGGSESRWIELGPLDQRAQDITITQNGEIIDYTTTEKLGWTGVTK